MPKWRSIRVRQELVAAARRTIEESRYRSLSEFVSEAIRLRLDEVKQGHERIAEKQAEYPLIRERLLYSPKHTWATVTPEGNARVGLSDYAMTRLKGIAGIQTDSVGSEVDKGKPFGVVETWLFMFDLYSPVSGRIAKVNKAVLDEPSTINRDPPEVIWIAEIKPNNTIALEEELRDLMALGQYDTWVSRQVQPRILSI